MHRRSQNSAAAPAAAGSETHQPVAAARPRSAMARLGQHMSTAAADWRRRSRSRSRDRRKAPDETAAGGGGNEDAASAGEGGPASGGGAGGPPRCQQPQPIAVAQPEQRRTTEVEVGENSSSWLRKTGIGRTPSLPSSLGKKKQSFLKVRRATEARACGPRASPDRPGKQLDRINEQPKCRIGLQQRACKTMKILATLFQ